MEAFNTIRKHAREARRRYLTSSRSLHGNAGPHRGTRARPTRQRAIDPPDSGELHQPLDSQRPDVLDHRHHGGTRAIDPGRCGVSAQSTTISPDCATAGLSSAYGKPPAPRSNPAGRFSCAGKLAATRSAKLLTVARRQVSFSCSPFGENLRGRDRD
jgi:hypothetical protein